MKLALVLALLALGLAARRVNALLVDCWGGGRCNDRAIGPETTVVPMHLDAALGKLLVADSPGQVREEQRDGIVHLMANSAAPVTTATYAPDGAVVWAQAGVLFRTTADGATAALPSAGLTKVQDIAFVDNKLWIADNFTDSSRPGGGIYALQYPPAAGAQPILILKSAYSGGNFVPPAQAPVWQPQGVAPGLGGTVLIADTVNHRIRRYTPSSGALVTVAGGGTADANGRYQSGFAGDGAPVGPGTLFTNPTDVLEAPDGTLFIADYANHRVRKIAGGVVSTVLGNGKVNSGLIVPDAGTDPTQFPATNPIGVALNGSTLVVSSAYDKRLRCVTDALGPPVSLATATATLTLALATLTATKVPATRTATPLPPCIPTATLAPTGTPQPPCL